MDPMEILPPEVWLIIFGNLERQDILNCMRTNSKWKLFMREPTLLLFPEVISHLINVLPKNDFLNCRQVCKSWKKDVDELYQNHPLHITVDHMHLSKELEWKHDGIRFSWTPQIEKFLARMKYHTDNPFPGRCIEIYDHLCNTPAYWISVRNLLQRFGKHIWYAYIKYTVRSSDPAAANVEKILRDCLILLPNLKKLFLDADLGAQLFDTEGLYQRISNYYTLNPMTKLNQMEVLSFTDNLPTPLHTEILRCSSKTLKKLDFCNYIYDGFVHLPNLEEANVMIEKLEDFEKIGLFPSSMKKISIKAAYNNQKPFSFEAVFKKLERFRKSLKELSMEVKLHTLKNRFKPNLRGLEKLTISVKGPLYFLPSLKGLKYLKIFNYKPRQWKRNRVEICGFENRMQESNIWNLMPSLDTVVLEGTSSSGNFAKTCKRTKIAAKL
ncbi:unnamed protein product [Orchesella dallaii]|uniref:F-box domain-containing protein n=1 Tax=Orchesella dallaii TaxID=48710 RepID=A0ABP1QTY1_9HEXA